MRFGFKKKASFAAAGAANHQHILVPGGLGVLGTAVHSEPFRLRQDNVVLKLGRDIRGNILGTAPWSVLSSVIFSLWTQAISK